MGKLRETAMRPTTLVPLLAALTVAACAGGPRDCCAPTNLRDITDAVPAALEGVCTIGFGMRETESLRADAEEHGFGFWGDFFESRTTGGVVDVRPGGHAGEPCHMEFMVDHDRGEAVDRALTAWAVDQGMTAPRGQTIIDGVGHRAYAGAVGSLEWSYTSSLVEDEPEVIVATLDLAVE